MIGFKDNGKIVNYSKHRGRRILFPKKEKKKEYVGHNFVFEKYFVLQLKKISKLFF